MALVDDLIALARAHEPLEAFLEAATRRFGLEMSRYAVADEFGGLTALYRWAHASRLATSPPADVERLLEAVSQLLADLEEIATVVIPYVEADYALKIGTLEYERFTLECGNLRLRKQIELWRASCNRGEIPCAETVERILDETFARWEAEARARYREIEAARGYLAGPFMPAETATAIKTLYRSLVKRLHPDLHGELGKAGLRYWLRVQAAYEAHDLEVLQTLDALVERLVPVALGPATPGRRDLLQRQLDRLLARHQELMQSFPCKLRESLKDAAWVAQRRAEILAAIERETATAAFLRGVLIEIQAAARA